MKNQRTMQLAAAVSAGALSLSLAAAPLPAAAAAPLPPSAGGIVSPLYAIITRMDQDLTLLSGGIMQCEGYTKVNSAYSAKTIVELQQNNGGWKTIKTWVKTGGTAAEIDETQAVAKGYDYRLLVTHSAYNANGTLAEIKQLPSNTVPYK